MKDTIPINDTDGFRGLALNPGLGLRAGEYWQASVGFSFRPR